MERVSTVHLSSFPLMTYLVRSIPNSLHAGVEDRERNLWKDGMPHVVGVLIQAWHKRHQRDRKHSERMVAELTLIVDAGTEPENEERFNGIHCPFAEACGEFDLQMTTQRQ